MLDSALQNSQAGGRASAQRAASGSTGQGNGILSAKGADHLDALAERPRRTARLVDKRCAAFEDGSRCWHLFVPHVVGWSGPWSERGIGALFHDLYERKPRAGVHG